MTGEINPNRSEQIRPIAPEEVGEAKLEQIPDVVISTFNELITQNGGARGTAKVTQDEVVEHLVTAGLDRNEIFEKHWLDVESLYREAGWEVKYDRPVYWGGENFDAYFEFRAPSQNRR